MGVVYLPSEDSPYRFLLQLISVSELKIDCRVFSSLKFSRRDFFDRWWKRADFIQKSCIFDAETDILRSFQFDLWTIDHEKNLEPQGIGVVLLLRYFFPKKINFSESFSGIYNIEKIVSIIDITRIIWYNNLKDVNVRLYTLYIFFSARFK